jgi:hypothetical protein
MMDKIDRHSRSEAEICLKYQSGFMKQDIRDEYAISDIELGYILRRCKVKSRSIREAADLKIKAYAGCENKNFKTIGTFEKIRRRAIRKKYPLDITEDYIWLLYISQNRKCALTGLDIVFKNKFTKILETTASLDRIDSSLGYIISNVQWVHKDINAMKINLDQQDFISLCRTVSNHQGSKSI